MLHRWHLNLMTVLSQARDLAEDNPEVKASLPHLEEAIRSQPAQLCFDWVRANDRPNNETNG